MGSHWDPIMCWGPIVSSLHEGPCSALWGPIVSLLRYGVPLQTRSLCVGVPLCPHCMGVPIGHSRFPLCPIVSLLYYGVPLCTPCTVMSHCVSIGTPLHSGVPLCPHCRGIFIALQCTMGSCCVPVALRGPIANPFIICCSPIVNPLRYGVPSCPCAPIALRGPLTSPLHYGVPLCPYWDPFAL